MGELPPSEVSGQEAREIADEVLSGRAYIEAARPPSLRERFFDWITELISDVFGSLSSVGGRGVTAWIVIGAFAVLIIFFVRRLLRTWAPLPAREVEADPMIDIESESSADEWMRLAAESEADGDWRMGIRSRHRALVAELVDRRLISLRPGMTAGEISALVAESRPEAASDMTEATYLFKDVWYGWLDAGPEQRDQFATLSDRVLAQAPAAPRRSVALAGS